MADMRALSVQQPWAACITYLGKDVENRTWPCQRRIWGARIAIHASKGIDLPDFVPGPLADGWPSLFAGQAEWDAWRAAAAGANPQKLADWPAKIPLGAVVAAATIADCHWHEDCTGGEDPRPCSPWAAFGQWHWRLENVRPLAEPIPCRGALGLWQLLGDVERAVRGQLDA